MPILILALFFCILVALGASIALSFALRYRAGTARRPARPWVVTMNVWATALGAGFFLLTAACMSFWVRQAFTFALMGMLAGAVLGMLGVALTRWESKEDALYYTPNRWLALLVVCALLARLAYGWLRGWHAGEAHRWFTASDTAISLSVAAAVIGYYFSYTVGVRRRLTRHHRRRLIGPDFSTSRMITSRRRKPGQGRT